jgi:hypothetical protein
VVLRWSSSQDFADGVCEICLMRSRARKRVCVNGKTDGKDGVGRSAVVVQQSTKRCSAVQLFARVDNRVGVRAHQNFAYKVCELLCRNHVAARLSCYLDLGAGLAPGVPVLSAASLPPKRAMS